jgi:hypothetical protein
MPSYTTRGKYTKQAKGENTNTWATVENTNWKDLADEALHGVEAITVSGSVTLTNPNGTSGQARQPVHVLTGTGGTVTVPNVENHWVVVNGCSAAVSYTAGSASASITSGEKAHVYCDGTDVYKSLSSVVDLSTAFSATSVTANALATGDLTYTIAAGKSFAPGMGVRIADSAAPATNYADGIVKSYATTTIVVTVTSVTGSGTPAAVTIGFASQDVTLPAAADGVLKSTSGGALSWLGAASQVEAEAGTDADKYMTPLRTAQAISALAGVQWTEIEAITVSGTASEIVFDDIPQTYSSILFVMDGVSHNDGGSAAMRAAISTDNGANYTSNVSISGAVAADRFFLGGLEFVNYTSGKGPVLNGISANTITTSPQLLGAGATANLAFVATGGINAVKFTPSGGSFDAGSITLYGL